jgi:hypothetical protein
MSWMSVTKTSSFRSMLSGGCRLGVDAVDVCARDAIDRIAHRIDVEFSGHAVFGIEYGHELDAGRFGEDGLGNIGCALGRGRSPRNPVCVG